MTFTLLDLLLIAIAVAAVLIARHFFLDRELGRGAAIVAQRALDKFLNPIAAPRDRKDGKPVVTVAEMSEARARAWSRLLEVSPSVAKRALARGEEYCKGLIGREIDARSSFSVIYEMPEDPEVPIQGLSAAQAMVPSSQVAPVGVRCA